MSAGTQDQFDYLLIGGGLQNGLLAWLLLARDPRARVALVEAGDALGGNHTWSFHLSDVPNDLVDVVSPLVQYRWDHYQVHFPKFYRSVGLGYGSLHSSHLARLLQAKFDGGGGPELLLNSRAVEIHGNRAVLESGRVLHGKVVVDARGPAAITPTGTAGFQKFVGLEVTLRSPVRLQCPVLMDACVPQEDGFRFFYVLPFAPDRILIEDTRFSGDARLDEASLQHDILRHAADRGYEIDTVVRTERGVLPMPIHTRQDWPAGSPLSAGYGGGLFHPATGYSFPVALRAARAVADSDPDSFPGPAWQAFLKAHQTQYRFATFLNRLLFKAYLPEHRYHIFKRFYHLPEAAIARFYRLEMTRADMARMFVGRPPRGFSLKRMVEGAPQP